VQLTPQQIQELRMRMVLQYQQQMFLRNLQVLHQRQQITSGAEGSAMDKQQQQRIFYQLMMQNLQARMGPAGATNRLSEQEIAQLNQQNESELHEYASRILPSDILNSEEDAENDENENGENYNFRPIVTHDLPNCGISPIRELTEQSLRISNPSIMNCLSPAYITGQHIYRSNFSLQSWNQVQGIAEDPKEEEEIIETESLGDERQVYTEM
jgi:hypothetical protein